MNSYTPATVALRIDYHNMGTYQDLFQVKPTVLYHAHQAVTKNEKD